MNYQISHTTTYEYHEVVATAKTSCISRRMRRAATNLPPAPPGG